MARERTLEGAGGSHPLSAVFISDTHLLHPQNGAASIHLRTIFGAEARAIYAVGDTIDLEAVETVLERMGLSEEQFPKNFADVLKLIEFPDMETHLRVIDTMMARGQRGDTVRLITGNHDIALDMLDGEDFNGIGIRIQICLQTALGAAFWLSTVICLILAFYKITKACTGSEIRS